MMPLAAILSTSDCASCAAVLAAALSVPATALRRVFRPVRSFERSRRFASRRLRFCRCALSADLLRLAKLSSLVGNGQTTNCTTGRLGRSSPLNRLPRGGGSAVDGLEVDGVGGCSSRTWRSSPSSWHYLPP